MFLDIHLEDEQRELLALMVEAARNVPKNKRQKFYFGHTIRDTRARITHEGLPGGGIRGFVGDLEALHEAGLLRLAYTSDASGEVDVRPEGYRYYEQMRQVTGLAPERMDAEAKGRVVSLRFQEDHPAAYRKWAEAEALLWSSESTQQLTTVGHLCREAMQVFADDLLRRTGASDASQDPAKTVARVRTVLEGRKTLSDTVGAFYGALLSYWGTVNDLVQRQEHGAKKDGNPLVWEDARRVVLYTALVMAELSEEIGRPKR